MISFSRHVRTLLISAVLVAPSGCSFFNSIGDHMPVMGNRCEYWQCFTQYGQEQSDLIKRERLQGASAQGNPADISDSATRQIPSQQQMPAAQTPSAQAPQPSAAPTPYDMTPEQLQNLPPPAVP